MNYIALYRKYRPQTFDEVIEQEAVVKILKEELKQGKASHAYLFAGPKGSGKTTLARIFAKGLNCVNGPTEKPCLQCENCLAIANGTSLDVIEIDAASNRGIDEIRNLKEHVQYVPVQSKYKVYIIDEAHMLTPQAFNALLKTLEEPPQNVIFILATTEVDKIPPTIASRCERLYFKPITIKGLKERIIMVAINEGAKITESAAELIALASSGSLRNALSLLEQVITISNEVDDALVRSLLDIPDERFLLNFVRAIIKNDPKEIFAHIRMLEEHGKDAKIALNELIEFFEDLISFKFDREEVVSEKRNEKVITEMKELLKFTTLRKLIDISKTLTELSTKIKFYNDPYFPMLLSLLDMTKLEEPEMNREQIFQKEVEEKREEEIKITPREVGSFEEEKVSDAKEVLDIEKIKSLWEVVTEEIKQKDLPLSVFLMKATPIGVKGDVIEILPDRVFVFEMLKKKENIEKIEQTISRIANRQMKISLIAPEEEKKLTKEERIKEIEKKKEIQEILNLFDGSITDIKEEKNEKF